MDKWFIDLIEEANDSSTSESRFNEIVGAVASLGDPYLICDFCEWVQRADTPRAMSILQGAIERSGDIVHIYEFAFLMADCKKQSVDYKSLQDKIISSENPKLISYCSEYVPAFDQRALAEGMIKCGNVKWLKHYIGEKGYYAGVEELDEDTRRDQRVRLEQRLELAKREEARHLPPKSVIKRYGILGQDLDEMRREVLTSADPYMINEMAENWEANLYETPLATLEMDRQIRVPEHRQRQTYGQTIEEYEDAIMRTGDMLHIYEFGASVPGADVERIMRAAKKIGIPKYMYYVGAYVPNADCKQMLAAIESCEDVPEYVQEKYARLMREHIQEMENSEPGEE